MRRRLLGDAGAGVGRRGDAAGGAAPAGAARGRVLAAEREPLHAVRHVLLQGVEEAHFRRVVEALARW